MKLRIYTTLLVLLTAFTVKAQDAEQPIDTLTRHVAGIRQELDVLKRIKLSGYIQAQYQVADSGGVPSFAGGNFASGVDKRFMLRRARLKVQYDSPFNDKGFSTSQYVFQIDLSEKGATIKDLYAKFTDPWCGWFSVTAGMQNRPFGYEIGYSSSLRESPERGRLSQIVFPGERDLGAMLTIQGPKTSNWNWLKIDAGYFNGLGGPSALATANEFDKFKDFIGHIGITRSTKSERIKWGLGASIYNGGYRVDTVNTYIFDTDSTGIAGFKVDTKKADVSANINSREEIKRSYIGFDGQFSIDWVGGLTTLRGEFIMGEQPGTGSSSASQAVASTSDFYTRKFNGMYLYFVQNIGHSPLQAIVKYDTYDPNTEVSGDEIGLATQQSGFKTTSAADIAYSTLGLGLAYRWDAAVKLTAYWDQVTNETSEKLANYTKDLKDNVFTLRLQVKF
ncbi:MAG: hypothetical protein ABI763_09845 [Bacteroidota bacterium]